MAPRTAQGTAFQENRRADSRPIVNGKFLDVEDYTSFHVPHYQTNNHALQHGQPKSMQAIIPEFAYEQTIPGETGWLLPRPFTQVCMHNH